MIGYLLIILMGCILGLIGAGGALLTLPILIYSFGLPLQLATSYTLALVALTSLALLIQSRKLIAFKKALLLALISFITVSTVRSTGLAVLEKFLGPALLDSFLHSLIIMLMLASGWWMIARPLDLMKNQNPKGKQHWSLTLLAGIAFGIITGLVGAGGGIILLPTLALILKVPTVQIVPTSLFLVGTNALIGTLSNSYTFTWPDYIALFYLGIFSLSGALIGSSLRSKIPTQNLGQILGYTIFNLGFLMLIKELYFH